MSFVDLSSPSEAWREQRERAQERPVQTGILDPADLARAFAFATALDGLPGSLPDCFSDEPGTDSEESDAGTAVTMVPTESLGASSLFAGPEEGSVGDRLQRTLLVSQGRTLASLMRLLESELLESVILTRPPREHDSELLA